MKRLTDNQKSAIHSLRSAGLGYKAIAEKLSLSRETVRSFCNRNPDFSAEAPAGEICKQCGRAIIQTPGAKKRVFCSDECRKTWWNAHPEELKKKAVYSYTCAACGKPFTAYGNSHRKYCSHSCYISDRFGKAVAV